MGKVLRWHYSMSMLTPPKCDWSVVLCGILELIVVQETTNHKLKDKLISMILNVHDLMNCGKRLYKTSTILLQRLTTATCVVYVTHQRHVLTHLMRLVAMVLHWLALHIVGETSHTLLCTMCESSLVWVVYNTNDHLEMK